MKYKKVQHDRSREILWNDDYSTEEQKTEK